MEVEFLRSVGKPYGRVSRELSGIDWNIAELGPMRVMASSTLYIGLAKKVLFRISGLSESGIGYTVPRLSLFRHYVEKTNALPDTFLPITFLDIILSCDNLGRGIGVFVALFVHGTEYGLGRMVLVKPLLSGIAC